jgi:hypothetical protein
LWQVKEKKFRIVKLIFVTRGIYNQTPGKKLASLRCLYTEKISVETIIFRKKYFLCFCCLNEISSKISKAKKVFEQHGTEWVFIIFYYTLAQQYYKWFKLFC